MSLRRFRIEACLGVGGYGDVFRAQMSEPSGRTSQVALKVLRSSKMADTKAFLRMRDEARVLGLMSLILHSSPGGFGAFWGPAVSCDGIHRRR